jgi:tetratricopeptide (TPR) repeat protein
MRSLLAVVAVWLALGCAACTRTPDAQRVASEAATLHAEADRLLDSGDRTGARQVLERLLHDLGQLSPGALRTDQAVIQESLKDVHYRLARLDLDAKNYPAALAHCEAGLRAGGATDLFTANLLVLRGTLHQELGQTVAAAEDFHRALLINEALLKQTLETSGGTP